MENTSKSPLTGQPLRYPGQSLDDEIAKKIDDEGITYIAFGLVSVVLAGLEWWRWYADIKPSPIIYSVLAVIVGTFSFYKVLKLKKQITKLKLGRDGERVVGQYLEVLREQKCKVYHDIIGESFNIDHVVISTRGVYTIETKTYSKPAKGQAIIVASGNRITINGKESQTDIVTQVHAQAHWMSQFFKENVNKSPCVFPVVVFPGWFVKNGVNGKSAKYWALNPKALPTYLANQPEVLTKDEVQTLSVALSRYIRSRQKELK